MDERAPAFHIGQEYAKRGDHYLGKEKQFDVEAALQHWLQSDNSIESDNSEEFRKEFIEGFKDYCGGTIPPKGC